MALRLALTVVAQVVIFLLFYAVFIPTLILAHAWKLFVKLVVRLRHGDSVQIMGACDAVSAHKPAPSKEGLIHAVFHVRGPISLKEVRRRVWDNLVALRTKDGSLKYPRLRQWVDSVMGLYAWRTVDNFDFHWHVDSYKDEVTGAKLSYKSKEEQLDLIHRIINSPMFPDGVAPWRVLLVSKDDGSESSLVIRSHHCLCDGGGAFMVILPAIADRMKDGDTFGNVKNGGFSNWRNKVYGMLAVPYLFSRQFGVFDKNPLREFVGKPDAPDGKWTAWSEAIPLSRVTAIRKKTGARFSSVLVAAISRAATRYIELKGGDENSRGTFSMSTYQAVSMWTPTDPPNLENRISGISTPMLVDMDKSVVEQLREINESQEFWLRQEFLWGAYTFGNLTCNTLPHVLAEKFVIPYLLGGITMFVSSLMGPSNVLTVDGNEVHGLTGIMPLPPTTSVGFVVLSYRDKLSIAVAGRKHAFPKLDDLKLLDSMVHEELKYMYETLAGEADGVGPPSPRPLETPRGDF